MEQFKELWAVDFEFFAPDGERPLPLCMVAQNVKTEEIVRLWLRESGNAPPAFLTEENLYIAYYASAEIGCHFALGWQVPINLCDLFAEHRVLTNGLGVRNGLLDACLYWGAGEGSSAYKKDMRDRIMAGPPYTEEERQAILDYCQTDVEATVRLYRKMETLLDGPRTLLRGRFMASVASMEWRGIPIDTEILSGLKRHWQRLQERMIEEVDQEYGVYDGRTFKLDRFEQYLRTYGIAWPRTETGRLSLTDDVFKDMTKSYPALQRLKDLRYILGQLRLNALAVGADGRNRALLSPFRAKTGRNAPSTSKFIFGPGTWLRGLIKPEQGRALAYVDYSQQEFALAGYLSGDQSMIRAYESGDPYLSFAQMAGAAPPDATKATHGAIRDQFKVCSLGVQYGMKEQSLARQLVKPPVYAKELLQAHKRTFKRFWQWQEEMQSSAILERRVVTAFGWQMRITPDDIRTLANWPMQATGADILRVAAIMLEEAGTEVLCPVHDAFLIESSEEEIEEKAAACQRIMEAASGIVLAGKGTVKTDVEIVRYPDRYSDKRGVDTWDRIMRLLEEIEQEGSADE
jgi:hypothetical protein